MFFRITFRKQFFILLSLFIVGCNNPKDNGADPNGGTGTAATTSPGTVTTKTLDDWINGLETALPSWAEIDQLNAGYSRQAGLTYLKRVNAYSDKFGQASGIVPKHLNYWTALKSTYGGNISSALLASMPPYVDSSGTNLTYPLTITQIDEQLRGYAVAVLAQRKKGEPVMLEILYPPNQINLGHPSEAAFRAWIDGAYTAEVQAEAAAAERLGVEYFAPFPIELEVFLENQTGFISTLTNDQKLALGQYFSDAAKAASTAFKGTLIAHLHYNYANGSNPYQNVSYAGWGLLAFSFFPNCDQATTDRYIDGQFTNYLLIASRSAVPWVVGELGVYDRYFTACGNGGTALTSLEPGIYQSFLTKLDAAVPAANGIFIDDDMRAQATKDKIIAYFAGK